MKRSQFLKTLGLGTLSLPALAAGREPESQKEELPFIKPKRLKRGDRVGLTAPAGIVFNEEDFDRMEKELTEMGLEVVFGEFVRSRFGYFAGTDRQRARDLTRFFQDPDIDGIIAVRGGWGCARILPYLDFEMIRNNAKIYCGFSDNTTLHLAFRKYSGLISYHGPNGASEWTDLTKRSFKSILMDGEKAVFESNRKTDVLFPGISEGKLIGGNLTILTTSLGTPYQPDLTDAILFVEDIGEPVYKIDRMLTHLARAGELEKISGFMFGGCTNCPEPSSGSNFRIRDILMQHIRPLGIPALLGVDISHDPDNFTVPVGLKAELNADDGTFRLLESPVLEEREGA
ncbi:MAG: LD-carboxypeptidase [Balneolaceae bacterium]|nr:LD-carboxypeptidase [Balneolaceae bacterium]MCH8547874.1 LD-carboxypeptidase [Balneolaceae bacterium]